MKKNSLITLFILGQVVSTLMIGLLISDFYPYFETWRNQMSFQEYIDYTHSYYPIYIMLLLLSIIATMRISVFIHKNGEVKSLYWTNGILVLGWISIIIFSREFNISTASLIASLICTSVLYYTQRRQSKKKIELI